MDDLPAGFTPISKESIRRDVVSSVKRMIERDGAAKARRMAREGRTNPEDYVEATEQLAREAREEFGGGLGLGL